MQKLEHLVSVHAPPGVNVQQLGCFVILQTDEPVAHTLTHAGLVSLDVGVPDTDHHNS